ncbi:MAG: FAD-binding oxidoreductase [Bdellovibrionaceae bacterium]|nr:FAD-binding oxidoreductase [Pseudobdellovibrionaceae bacterium]
MNEYEFDIVIIGGGCIGSSIAFHLAQKGFRHFAIVDSGRKNLSATSQSGGLLRVFHENTDHVDLALRHHELKKTLQTQNILLETNTPNGSLYFFDRRRFNDYTLNLHKMEAAGYPFEIVTAKTGATRFPMFAWNADSWAVYEPLGNHASANQFCDDLLDYSQHSGLTMIDNFEVERICFFRDRYRLFNRAHSVFAKTLIFAGGARSIPHLHELGIGHSLKAQELKVYKSKESLSTLNISNAAENSAIPNFFDREKLQYSGVVGQQRLIVSDLSLEKLNHCFDPERFQEIWALDCYAPQRLGYAGFLAGHPRLLLATGWGGTAFKFSLEIGHRIAQALENKPIERSIAHA